MAGSVKFIKSAVLPQDYPPAKRVEIAISGRSNAGKSSFINSLARQKIAKVSATPGKTRLLNFFEVGPHYTLVDMPGYGWASRHGDEMADWQQMIESYLTQRHTLVGMLLVMDIRRKWDDHEEMIVQFAAKHGFNVALILTKSDKLSKNEIAKARSAIERDSGVSDIFIVSNLKNLGSEEVEEFVFEAWVRPHLEQK